MSWLTAADQGWQMAYELSEDRVQHRFRVTKDGWAYRIDVEELCRGSILQQYNLRSAACVCSMCCNAREDHLQCNFDLFGCVWLCCGMEGRISYPLQTAITVPPSDRPIMYPEQVHPSGECSMSA